jgi:hypothetical protein
MTGKAALLIVTLASSFVYKSIDLALNSSIFLAVLFYSLCMDKDPEAFIRDLLPLPSVTAAAATTTTTTSSSSGTCGTSTKTANNTAACLLDKLRDDGRDISPQPAADFFVTPSKGTAGGAAAAGGPKIQRFTKPLEKSHKSTTKQDKTRPSDRDIDTARSTAKKAMTANPKGTAKKLVKRRAAAGEEQVARLY